MIKQRIDAITQECYASQSIYKLKSTQTLNRNIGLYTTEQLEYIRTELKDYLYFFGYV